MGTSLLELRCGNYVVGTTLWELLCAVIVEDIRRRHSFKEHSSKTLVLRTFVHIFARNGGIAQLARALAWHARGHRFESDYLHEINPEIAD